MRRFRGTRSSDLFFLHSDDRATIRYKYSSQMLREALLYHLLFFDRVLVPVNLLLANPELDSIFCHRGEVSEQSEVYRLIESGAIVPTLFRRDYGSIGEYARYALEEEKILLPCSKEQWLQRADLLDAFRYAVPKRDFRATYKQLFLRLIQDERLQQHYFEQCRRKGSEFATQLVYELCEKGESLTRSDVYKATEQA